MTREEFKNLDILSQVNFINEELKIHKSITNVCKVHNLRRATIQSWFEKEGYILNRNINQYVSSNGVATNITNVSIESNDKAINKSKKINNTNTKDNKYKALEEQIKDLQKQIDIQTYTKNLLHSARSIGNIKYKI